MVGPNRKRLLIVLTLSSSVASSEVIAQSLQGENARDIARFTTPTITQINDLRNLMTTEFVLKIEPSINIKSDNPYDQILFWHTLALNVTAIDHTGQIDAFGNQLHMEQFGPHRTSYALAVFHIAIFEVANAYPSGARFKSWVDAKTPGAMQPPPKGANEAAAVIEAAYISLAHLYKNMDGQLKMIRDQSLAQLPGDKRDIEAGRLFGETIANKVIAARTGDNTDLKEPRWGIDFVPKKAPLPNGSYPAGQWQIDPVSGQAVALGGNWPKVVPFVLTKGDQFRNVLPDPPPPTLTNQDYKEAYKRVFLEGGDVRHSVERKDTPERDHYFRAKFWAYDGTAGLCAPARLYNQIADEVLRTYTAEISPHAGRDKVTAASEIARYYAVVNTAMADAGIAAWDAKYAFQYWRPITGIRYEQARESSGGNADLEKLRLVRKPVWFPLGAQTTNSQAGYNITPPFPSYPSGHAVFGGALFKVFSLFIHHDHGFKFQSDEFNGKNSVGRNIDAYNFVRCKTGDKSVIYCKPLSFATFKEAEEDNANSRVWMGVHWNFDATFGDKLGEIIGEWTFKNAFSPAG